MQRLYIIAFFTMLICAGWQWHLRPSEETSDETIVIERFDRAERLYLSTGDFAALQQMKTVYPEQTRKLIEDVLQLGQVDEADINTRFLLFFQDSTLQALMYDVDTQFTDIDDISSDLNRSFKRLSKLLPPFETPEVYTQIGSLDQSVVVGNGQLGISLDKYLGSNHPVYLRYGYTERQRSMMTRSNIVPDCIGFFLLSIYPAKEGHEREHFARIQYVVNRAMGRKIFMDSEVKKVEQYMLRHPSTTLHDLLSANN